MTRQEFRLKTPGGVVVLNCYRVVSVGKTFQPLLSVYMYYVILCREHTNPSRECSFSKTSFKARNL